MDLIDHLPMLINGAKLNLLRDIKLDLRGCTKVKDIEFKIKMRIDCLEKINTDLRINKCSK